MPIDQLNSAAAIEACKKAVEDSPLARYQYQLGRAQAKEVKLTDALHWHRKAAEQGHVVAQSMVGTLYEAGLGVERDRAEAMKWYRLAAAQGVPLAQASIGLAYLSGDDVPQDYAEAMKWYRKAADQGVAAAQYSIAKMHINGQGVPRDYAEAMKWYRKASARGGGLQGLPEA